MAREYCSEERLRMRDRLEAVASWYDPSHSWESLALERLSTQWSAQNAQIAALVASERWREGKPPT